MTNDELVEKMLEFRADAEEGNRPTFDRMSKCERFKVGNQWDPDVRSRNDSKRKFSLTINRVLPTVNQITGMEVQNPRDVQVLNKKGGSRVLANLLTALTKHTLDLSHTQRQKSMMFDDGVTTARGWIGADKDYSQDPHKGDIVIKKYDPFMVLPDPNRSHYDLNVDSKYVIVDEWVDKEKLEKQKPSKKNDLMNTSYSVPTGSGRFSRIVNFMFNRQTPGSVQDDYRDHQDDEVEGKVSTVEKYSYRKSTYWWKKWQTACILQRIDDPLNFNIYTKSSDMSAARIVARKNPDKVRFIDKDREGLPLTIGVLKKTVLIGNVFWSHDDNPLNGVNLFPIVPFCPYFQNGYEFGIVQNLIGPQEQINWSWSMELNLIKKLANAGWRISKATAKWKDWLKSHGTEDGIVIEESNFGGKVDKMELNKFPVGFDIMTEKGSRHIAEISNVRLESPQTDKDRVASAIRLKQASAFTGNATLFSNYDFSMEIFGGLIVAMIRKCDVFSEEEIRAIVDEEDLIDRELMDQARQIIIGGLEQAGVKMPEPIEAPDMNLLQSLPQELQQMQMNEYQEIMASDQALSRAIDNAARPIAEQLLIGELNKLNKGRYDTKVALAPMAETMRAIKAIETMELNKCLIDSGHQPLSRRRLIEVVDPVNKDLILAEEGV